MILYAPGWVFVLMLSFASCALRAEEPAPAPAPAAATETPVTCPQCDGEGTSKCEVKGCLRGKVPCPRTCLKKTDDWETKKDPSHPDWKRWRRVYNADRSTSAVFPDTLIGHVIYDNAGAPTDGGICPDCKGTGLVDCPACHGTGKAQCSLCGGLKTVSPTVAKEFTDKRDLERAAHAIILTDGTVIYGKVVTRMPDKVMIKTDEGKMIDVDPAKIKSEPPPEAKAPRKPKEPAAKK